MRPAARTSAPRKLATAFREKLSRCSAPDPRLPKWTRCDVQCTTTTPTSTSWTIIDRERLIRSLPACTRLLRIPAPTACPDSGLSSSASAIVATRSTFARFTATRTAAWLAQVPEGKKMPSSLPRRAATSLSKADSPVPRPYTSWQSRFTSAKSAAALKRAAASTLARCADKSNGCADSISHEWRRGSTRTAVTDSSRPIVSADMKSSIRVALDDPVGLASDLSDVTRAVAAASSSGDVHSRQHGIVSSSRLYVRSNVDNSRCGCTNTAAAK
mmetsp:Transcript_14379/g.37034  ORF Transcript_14379/g.37034 Transcript_14379/m.37034 type:complete len:272 (+) Transcript_14379:285-1100(+)